MKPSYFLTAYDIAVKHGFRGTEKEWLETLSAFYLARQAGFQGGPEEWIEVLNDPVPNIAIGTVTTLDGGSAATASITGDKRNPLLNLGIPRGMGMMDALPLVGGKMKGPIDMDGHFIKDLPDPTEESHAVPKKYADERLKKDGSEAMKGALDMNYHSVKNLPDPTEEGHAVPKKYADERLKKDGSEAMKGALDMDYHSVKNLPSPTDAADAANKEYVDSRHFVKTVALPASGWSGEGPYSQMVAVEGILETDTPHWGLLRSGEAETKLAQKEAFSLVDDLDTADGSVTFTCDEDSPEVDLTIQMEVNR